MYEQFGKEYRFCWWCFRTSNFTNIILKFFSNFFLINYEENAEKHHENCDQKNGNETLVFYMDNALILLLKIILRKCFII